MLHRCHGFCKRACDFRWHEACGVCCVYVQKGCGRFVEHGYAVVPVEHYYAHRRCFYEQVEKVVLLAYAQALALEAFHHVVEHVDDAVGLGLSDMAQAAAEILFPQQIYASCECAYGFYHAHSVDRQPQDGEQQDAFGGVQGCA